MARVLGLPRYAAILAGIPVALALSAGCGGSDVVDQTDGSSADGLGPDGGGPDSPGTDGTMPDGGSQDADATAVDSGPPDADAGATDTGTTDTGIEEAGTTDADAAALDADAEAEATDADAAGLLDAEADVLGDTGLDVDASLPFDAGLDAALDANLDAPLDSTLDATDASFDAPDEADSEASVLDSGTGGLMQSLFTAGPFVVLGGATVTNSGASTVLIGDVGTTGPSITGLIGPPSQPSGTTEINNARATQAVLDLGTAYNSLTGQACSPANHLTGMDLGGMTLAPGVYCFTSSAGQNASTVLTFDAKGDPNAVWIIQVATALTVLDNAAAVIIGGPPSLACRIFWTTGTGATINSGSHYLGNILASSQTSLLTNATLSPGRAFGITGGVTLLSNTVTAAACQ